MKAWLFLSLLSLYSRLIYGNKTRLTGFHLVLEDMLKCHSRNTESYRAVILSKNGLKVRGVQIQDKRMDLFVKVELIVL